MPKAKQGSSYLCMPPCSTLRKAKGGQRKRERERESCNGIQAVFQDWSHHSLKPHLVDIHPPVASAGQPLLIESICTVGRRSQIPFLAEWEITAWRTNGDDSELNGTMVLLRIRQHPMKPMSPLNHPGRSRIQKHLPALPDATMWQKNFIGLRLTISLSARLHISSPGLDELSLVAILGHLKHSISNNSLVTPTLDCTISDCR